MDPGGKNYLFEGPDGKERLPDLFAGNRQLIVCHFMVGTGWDEGELAYGMEWVRYHDDY